MSDEEGGRQRRGGYRIELSPNARAACKGTVVTLLVA